MTEVAVKLPDVRNELHVLAADIEAAGLSVEAGKLRRLAEETRRRRPVKRAPSRARRITAEVVRAIRDVARSQPDWSNRKIGQTCGVDGGRVSEVLAGRRK